MIARRPASQTDARLHTATGLSDPPIARGRTAEIYAWQDGTVLKLFYEWCPSQWVQAEIRTARIVSETGLPTPRLLDTAEVNGRQGIVFERVEGPSMLRALSARPWMVRTGQVSGRCARRSGGLSRTRTIYPRMREPSPWTRSIGSRMVSLCVISTSTRTR
jgi:hypothetical protein